MQPIRQSLRLAEKRFSEEERSRPPSSPLTKAYNHKVDPAVSLLKDENSDDCDSDTLSDTSETIPSCVCEGRFALRDCIMCDSAKC